MASGVEENATLLELDNETNITGREAATPAGIAVTYSSLFLMALGPILIGSFRSVTYHAVMKSSGKEAADRIRMYDAAMFPFYASGGLFGLYLFFKYLPKEYVNLILSLFFLALGISALTRVLCSLLSPHCPQFILKWCTKYNVHVTAESPDSEKEEATFDFNSVDVGMFFLSVLIAVVYFFTKQWVLNNLFGLAFSLNAVEMISLDSVKVGFLLLGGLFVYDIFWVFGTDVMVTVAKGLEAPIKLMFPMDILEKGFLQAHNFGMLGLGDIVVPGLFLALLCRFDFSVSKGRSNLYFYTGFVAYILGLGTTIGVMHVFKAAQPALLYLVPFCLGLPTLVALVKGDLIPLFKYVDYPEDKDKDKASKDGGEDETTSEAESSCSKKEN